MDEARQALARYETAFPGEPALAEFASRIEAAGAPAAKLPIPEEGVSEIELPAMTEEPTVAEIPLEPAEAEPEPVAETEPEAAPVGADDGDTYDIVLEEQPKEAAPAASAAGLSAADFFSDLAGELDRALETAKTPAAPAKRAAPPPAAKAAPPPPAAAGPQPPVGVLAELFEEFKEEMGATEEVEETESHYNLGIAYKEMGVLDEAVSEFQKVAKAAE